MARVINIDPPRMPDEPMVWEPLSPGEAEEMERAELAQKPWLRAAAPSPAASPPAPGVLPPPPIHSPSIPSDAGEDDAGSKGSKRSDDAGSKGSKRSALPPRRLDDGRAKVQVGRTPADGVTPRTVSVRVPLTPKESDRLDRHRGPASRADTVARASGVRFDGPAGLRADLPSALADTEDMILEREAGTYRIRTRAGVIEFHIRDWVNAVLRVSREGNPDIVTTRPRDAEKK